MIRKFILASIIFAGSVIGASAQNTQCANKAFGDNSNACANTRFVQSAIGTIPLTPPGGTTGQIQYNNAGVFGGFTDSGDFSINTATGVGTLATVNANTGAFGSATSCVTFTTNGKGLITAASQTTCTPAIGSVTGLGTGVATALGTAVSTAGGVPIIIAKGNSIQMGTSAISSATCATAVTVSATGVVTTDTLNASFSADPTAVTGYVPLTSGGLVIYPYLSANNVNFKVCNFTTGSITPGAVGLNYIVIR